MALSDNLNAQFEASGIVVNVLSDIPAVKLSTDGRSMLRGMFASRELQSWMIQHDADNNGFNSDMADYPEERTAVR